MTDGSEPLVLPAGATDSPMMRQWARCKRAHPDALLLFRMGDFYETFFDDAPRAAEILGITLTNRGKVAGQDFPLAGFPYHKLEPYLARLVSSGVKVAIAEQLEDPKLARGLVERDVIRIVTAGTLTEDGLLDERRNNFLAALVAGKSGSTASVGVAWADLSTGEFALADMPATELEGFLDRLAPAECLLPADDHGTIRPAEAGFTAPLGRGTTVCSPTPAATFHLATARRALTEHFRTATLAGFGITDDTPAVAAAGALVAYLRETQLSSLAHVVALKRVEPRATMALDRATLRTLEITQTLRDGERRGSLIDVVDRTRTAMGARRLRRWLIEPLVEVDAIVARQDAVAALVADDQRRREAREALGEIQDLERLAARIATNRASPRDLAAIATSARALTRLAAALAGCTPPLVVERVAALDALDGLRARIESTLRDEVPNIARDGGVIRPGFSAELDELVEIASAGAGWMARFQEEEIKRTGITSLKVGYTSVFGYYIEITNAHRERVPPEYTRKQTLKNAERYITAELKSHEERLVHARERSLALEVRLFEELRQEIAQHLARVLATAGAVADLDVLLALAELGRRPGYVRPVVETSSVIEIVDGRHPVVEALLADGSFVPNDLHLDGEAARIVILTGPNMAGKSTYIRQVAIIALLAQIGAFVPARRARIGVVDRIFTRLGAGDEVARGASTFMVEMSETASILHHATARSLVILDEVGRGTSTYDGVAIAWAITEHLATRLRARTLFATHYHELTELADSVPGIVNFNVAVRERGDEIVFLHRIAPGGTDKSYGIHVARLAGIPQVVVDRARTVLVSLEEAAGRQASDLAPRPGQQALLFPLAAPPSAVETRLDTVEPDALSPRAALELVYELKSLRRGKTPGA